MVTSLRSIKITVEVDTNKYTASKTFEYDTDIDESAMDVMERASDYLERELDNLG